MLRHKCKKMITYLYHLLKNSENLKEERNGVRIKRKGWCVLWLFSLDWYVHSSIQEEFFKRS